jgi:hypothetical protein
MASHIQDIQNILAKQSSAGRPIEHTCAVIAAIKDLCDLHGGMSIDWRKGSSGNTSPQIARPGSGRPVFRNGSASSLSPGAHGGGTSLQRTQSARSFGGGSSGNTSPVAPAGGYMPSRYQSKFKNLSQPVEDKILNNIILSKLNKFSGATYSDVRDFLYQILGSGEPDLGELVRQFMLLVFKKAASEEVYCALYARLLAEISTRYKVILEEMHKLQANYLEIFDEIEEVPEGGDNYAAFVEKNNEKRYRQGYSQFLAELAGLEIMELSHLEQTFRKLMTLTTKYATVPDNKTLIEEYADCLARMSRVLKKKPAPFFTSARAALLSISKPVIDTLLEKRDLYPSLSPKARFILMDVKDNLA